MELINTLGTRVHVRAEHAETLLAAGYRRPDTEPRHARTARRKTTRNAHRPPEHPDDPSAPAGSA